jgi:hypothetical protein
LRGTKIRRVNGTGLFIGRSVATATCQLETDIRIDSRDLLTHGVLVGMTGSGKTGLAVALIEETLRAGLPVLAIDPKGDLGNLLLAFDDLDAARFEPWVDVAAAKREGLTASEAAARAAGTWAKGLAEWGLGAAEIRAMNAGREAVIFTPGSTAGRGLSILGSLSRPPRTDVEPDVEETREEIAAIVSGILGLMGMEADPLQSREFILLSAIIEHSWREGRDVNLEDLVGAIAHPPMERLGALPVDTVFPRADRTALMLRLNNLLASPQFLAWRAGDPLDVESLLRAKDGRPRLSIIYTAHLTDLERMFVTALVLDKVRAWVRRQSGTSELRALLYMDEVFGYLPPHPANPSTKKPLLTLLKQARAQGLGVVLATQNPVDLDYKALSNMGTWFVGKLQTENDANRVLEGLTSAGLEASRARELLGATRKRVFLLHDVHRGGPELIHSRFVMSYLRGPMTREDVQRLMRPAGVPAPDAPAPVAAGASAPPVLPDPYRPYYFSRYGGTNAEPYLFVKYAVRIQGMDEIVDARLYELAASSAAEILDGDYIDLDDAEAQIAAEAPSGLRYGSLPEFLAAAGSRGIDRAVKERLSGEFTFDVLIDPVTRERSHPDESRMDFAARLAARDGGEGGRSAAIARKLERKKGDLVRAVKEFEGREQEKKLSVLKGMVDVGGSLLGGLFGGRRGSALSAIRKGASAMGGLASKDRMEGNAGARVAALHGEVEALERELREAGEVDPGRFEQATVAATKAGTKLLRTEIVWVY